MPRGAVYFVGGSIVTHPAQVAHDGAPGTGHRFRIWQLDRLGGRGDASRVLDELRFERPTQADVGDRVDDPADLLLDGGVPGDL